VEILEMLGSVMGLGFVAGMRLYATILALGLAIRFNWIHLSSASSSLEVLAHPAVLITAGVACGIEFFADKIPWLDTAWDSFHTFLRPIGAALLAAAAVGHADPVLKMVLIVLCGGVALASHSSKMATRVIVNHSPEPFSNVAMSLAGDAFVPVATWVAVAHPLVGLAFVLAFLAVFLWMLPKVIRALRSAMAFIRNLFSGRTAPQPPQSAMHLHD
jgi:hypothetical protein